MRDRQNELNAENRQMAMSAVLKNSEVQQGKAGLMSANNRLRDSIIGRSNPDDGKTFRITQE